MSKNKKLHAQSVCLLSLFLSCSLFLAGCVPVLIGTGVVAGYTLSNAAAIGNLDIEYRDAWDIVTETLDEMNAECILSNESKGIVKSTINGYYVVASLNTLAPKVQRLKISARKSMLPKPHFAQKIFQNILLKVK